MEDKMQLFIGVFPLDEAKKLKKELSIKGIAAELRTNDKTCTQGCKVTVELWGDETSRDGLIDHFQNQHMKDLDGLNVNFDILQEVYDPNAAEVICQACGAKFAPAATECPDCGLVYG